MSRKYRMAGFLQSHTITHGKRGFTLVELSVVIALIAILATMTVSFSVMMNGFADDNKAEYQFVEETAVLKKSLTAWAAEYDAYGNVFTVHTDYTLTVDNGGEEKAVLFSEKALYLDGVQASAFDTIDGILFYANDKLIRCEVFGISENGERISESFVFSLRSAAIAIEEEADDD